MKAQTARQAEPATTAPPARSGVLQRKCACGGTPGPTGECAECRRKKPLGVSGTPLQPKLRIGRGDDPLEREADRVAEQVMRMPEPDLQRQRSKEEELSQAKPSVQRRVASTEGGLEEAPSIVHEALRSPGRPLDEDTRAFFEPRFGYDFSGVRIHTESNAAATVAAVNAKAFAVGRDIVFGTGMYAPRSAEGRHLIAHELTHIIHQGGAERTGGVAHSFHPAIPSVLQRDIAEDQLPNTPVERIMADPNYFENGIQRIEFYGAELAILHYSDGARIRLGLVPEYIEAPFQAVDYRTPRSLHLTFSSTAPSLGRGSVRFLPRGRQVQFPHGTTYGDVIRIMRQVGRTIRFTHHPSGRIVPTEVNSISAPRLCQALREAEAEYVRQMDAMARGAVQVLHKLEWIIVLGSLVGGLGASGLRAAAGRAGARRIAVGRASAAATTGVVGRAQSTLARLFARLLRTGGMESVTVEGVGFGGVRAAMRGTELVVSRGTIVNASRIAGRGRLIHSAFEQAAIQVARQAGARTVRIALEMVHNPKWAAYLESRGYTFELIANEAGGVTRVLTKVFKL